MILTFHYHGTSGSEQVMLPSCYLDEEYGKVSVSIHAVTAPLRDASFDVYADGNSIFSIRSNQVVDTITGVITDTEYGSYIKLPAGQNVDEMADDFENDLPITGVITCKLIDAGGGSDFTVQLNLEELE